MIDKELLIIILGATFSCAFYYLGVYRRKQKEKKQERLDRIK